MTGYDDEILGERVGAVVVPTPGEAIEVQEISAYLLELGIAVFKLPEQLRVVSALPTNATGKVLRRELRPLFNEKQPLT